ncbi:transposase [Natrinema sp. 1APR25-10V2]|uniref:transposase n=1 Tax=Natrinema sp. 1APR25-10V2 TaxID=2951081 RepID=UPI002875B00A|nr:transposase [Natrinema sp. 1APR25-10V2]MDS0477405.1 transposase [Natrinema sp. 1APR25-10V2]
MSDDFGGGYTMLAKDAADRIDSDTTAVDMVAALDVSIYARNDPYADSHRAEPFEPMFRAILLAELEDYYISELRRRLDHPEVAIRLGFDPQDVPRRSTFTRARNNRFAELATTIETAARQIRAIAAERGSPIGASFASDEEDRGSSTRTEYRFIRQKTNEVIDEMEQVVFPALNLPRPDNSIYDEEELLSLETLMAIDRLAANNGGDQFGDYLDPTGELDSSDPFHEDGPTGETLLEAIKELEPEAISEMVNRAAARILARAKPLKAFERPVMLSIDITYVAYYGDRDELVRVQGAPEDKEYDWCHKYATANVVGDNVHFVVAMLPVGDADYHNPDAYPGEKQSYRVGDVVRQLLSIATEQVSARCVLADREFYAGDVIAAFHEYGLKYVIPARRTARVKRFVARMDGEVAVEHEYALYAAVKHGTTQERVVTKLVGLPADEDYDEPQPFITNLDVDDEIRLDREETKRMIERYRRRGAIETAYKKIKEFTAWTTSKAFEVRLFHFGFGVLLYNMWLLVDFLVQDKIDGEFRPKPRLTASRFRGFLERRIHALL